MTHFLIITFIIFLINSTKATCVSDEVEKAPGTCGPDEVERAPGTDCKSDCCPVPEGKTSSACVERCLSNCTCANRQQVYNASGICISARECPPIPCAKNEQYDPCPNSFCSDKCSNAQPMTASGQRCRVVGRIGVVVICRPACTCIPEYFRKENNECVYYKECPGYKGNSDEDDNQCA